jgi:hypothetical protein
VLKSEHESYELKRAASKDVEAYLAKSEQERRESLANQNKERARHARVMEELISIAKAEETESYKLKWAGENDVKEYLRQAEEERRMSFRFRCKKGKRHREIEEEMRRMELMRKHEDVELRAAGKCKRIVADFVQLNDLLPHRHPLRFQAFKTLRSIERSALNVIEHRLSIVERRR